MPNDKLAQYTKAAITFDPVPVEPVERDIEVTLTLTFPESTLRHHTKRSSLGAFLNEQFGKAPNDGGNGLDLYKIARSELGVEPSYPLA